jgi:hypothetical protein
VQITGQLTVVCDFQHAAAGWHPKRFEFEPEWDNDAEMSIADIEFREEDSPQEVAAKLRLLEIYNLRLDEVSSACCVSLTCYVVLQLSYYLSNYSSYECHGVQFSHSHVLWLASGPNSWR